MPGIHTPCRARRATLARPWGYDSAPNTTAGSTLCGRVEGGDDVAVEWTKDRDLLLALASGPDLAGLYNWWKANRS
ncbi:kinase domain protein [Mycobacterium kansasii 824]|nr:kinase domain protein [Mycobacterium kansasii 824]